MAVLAALPLKADQIPQSGRDARAERDGELPEQTPLKELRPGRH
jgi:hypothetical protein